MGVIIYVDGEIRPQHLTEAQKTAISNIKNIWGEEAFYIYEDGHICFAISQYEGCSPFEDGVEEPLKELAEHLKAENIILKENAVFTVASDWSDYDDITLTIDAKTLQFRYENTEVINASTEELIAELKKRGYEVVQKSA